MNSAALGSVILNLLEIFTWLIIGRCLLSFFPALNWMQQPWQTLHLLTEPIMGPFRRLIPPFGGMDFSPFILLLVLNLLRSLLRSLF